MSKKTNVVPQLIFTPHGTVEFHRNKEIVWSSDTDEEFAEEYPEEFFSDEEDSDNIIEWLIDSDLLDEDEEIEIIEQALSESNDDEGDDYE